MCIHTGSIERVDCKGERHIESAQLLQEPRLTCRTDNQPIVDEMKTSHNHPPYASTMRHYHLPPMSSPHIRL